VGRRETGGAAFGGDGRIASGSAIAAGMVEEQARAGNLFLIRAFVIEAARERA
jgi:hypothetical protein